MSEITQALDPEAFKKQTAEQGKMLATGPANNHGEDPAAEQSRKILQFVTGVDAANQFGGQDPLKGVQEKRQKALQAKNAPLMSGGGRVKSVGSDAINPTTAEENRQSDARHKETMQAINARRQQGGPVEAPSKKAGQKGG